MLHSIRDRLARLEHTLASLEKKMLETHNTHATETLKSALEEYHTEPDCEVKLIGKYAVARTYGEGVQP